MSERVIKTGLSKKYKDMLDAVIGQMSDGYWENTPMMAGYWKFVTTGTAGDEVTLEVDETSGARDGDRRIVNRFYGLPDDAVKKFFADKIKFLIKEEGLGKWDRGNESETDFLSYGKPRYRVKDCYYAYEVLKGRNARTNEAFDGWDDWDGWEEVEGLEDAINGIEQLAYELRTSVRGSKTRCKTWAELGAHIAQLGSDLAEAGENASMKPEAKKKKKSPSKNFSSTVEEDEDGRKLSH